MNPTRNFSIIFMKLTDKSFYSNVLFYYYIRSYNIRIFVATLNISELHHPKCGSNMINNFGEIVSSLLTADHTCRRSEDESWEGLLLLFTKYKILRKSNMLKKFY